MMTHTILLALAPIFFVMGLGYVAGRLRIVDNSRVEGLNTLTMSFALPASLFVAMASAPRGEIVAEIPLFLLLSAVMLVIFAAWYIGVRRLLGVSRTDASLQGLTIAFPNLAGVGLPIASALLGPAGTVQIAVAIAAGSIIISPLSLVIVELDSAADHPPRDRKEQIISALKHAVTKPVVIAPVLGIAFSLMGIRIDSVIEACLRLIGQSAAGIALFLTGLILSAQAFRPDWRVIAATGMADVLRPAIMAIVVFGLAIPMDVGKVAILLAAVPSGFFGILFAVNYGSDSTVPGSIVIASTIFSIVTMSFVIAVLPFG